MKVNLAVQVLSHSVSAAMHTLADLQKIPIEAKQTADFTEKFNCLIDLLNSASTSGGGQKSAISARFLDERCRQLELYTEWIRSWKFEDQRPGATRVLKSQLEFQKGLIITVSAVKGLVQRLISERGYQYVCTRRLGQDCVENLFSVIRRDKGGYNSHPEAHKAIQHLRMACCEMLLGQTKTQNCEDSGGDLLVHIGEFIYIKNVIVCTVVMCVGPICY